jgi:DNA-binding transcriptional ArsR family regulator
VVLRQQSVSSLSRQYEMSFAAVQKHVAVLEHAELVTKHRHGREQLVRANTNTLRRAVELLDSYEQLWVQRAKQITELLTNQEGEADDRHPL